ncbi:C6 transcription factor (Ctf1B) [Rasamsonia emersonii CBS 393.64]|uniref:C6 transcription factor (Ctf1B) n=1 Tax=Rasamsonia emersonii (strain ATCC 16479 / CBS 393.64 / IMI 116815) TaxID=1408163 RepID=A0A0F4YWV7_RASE3|nr:C6 transcription factor (Ctf1B) [Rasamsonia emersonii CBS 393.64]KKA22699.1 C6 transcription factor (Ctf1B) [Rasamsonia emersonii CBS 393.64]
MEPTRSSCPPFLLSLPPFISPLPNRIPIDDLIYLEKQGALTIPEPALSPCLAAQLRGKRPRAPAPAGSAGLDSARDRQQQRCMRIGIGETDQFTSFSDGYVCWVDLLYILDCETDRVAQLQAVLLFTYWSGERNDALRDNWHWMNISLSMAQALGLHRQTAGDSDGAPRCHANRRKRGLERRLWWSCYIRDKLIALTMRRPFLIDGADCDVPMLVLEDFETDIAQPTVASMLRRYPAVADTFRRTELAVICIERAKLCLAVGKVLSTQYTVEVRACTPDDPEPRTYVAPKKKRASPTRQDVMDCVSVLDAWNRNLPEAARYWDDPSHPLFSMREVTKIHRATLRMIYLATLSALFRPLVSSPLSSRAEFASMAYLAQSRSRETAFETVKLSEDLKCRGLVPLLPPVGVTALVPTAYTLLLDVGSEDVQRRNSAWEQLQRCLETLSVLRDLYATAELATTFLRDIIAKVGRATLVPAQAQLQAQIVDRDGVDTDIIR